MFGVVKCSRCKKLITKGYQNEFSQRFCSLNCYDAYCTEHNYGANRGYLQKFEIGDI